MNSELEKIKAKLLHYFRQVFKASIIEGQFFKKENNHEKELSKIKNEALKLSAFTALFVWLLAGAYFGSIILGAAIATTAFAGIFVIIINAPLSKKRIHAKKVEAQLPFFLLKAANQLSLGKSFSAAIKDSLDEEEAVSKEFGLVLRDVSKGAGFEQALNRMNARLGSLTIRRATSSLCNIQKHGKKDSAPLKKLAQELLLKQRIESKEFSGKMTVFALVFIAVSAIVPAMFQSFVLVGSYFMSIQFTPFEIFVITAAGFPLVDLAVLFAIEKKTPLFLRT